MGAYVSKPVTDKCSFDGENKVVSYGASSMQGWRIAQEDAHNAIVDFDDNTCFFAVYDGHGGHEVAEYTAQKLPEFIKQCSAYQEGELSRALIDSFLKFDASLITPQILNILKEISGTKDEASPDSDKEEVDNLCKEASMPLDEVIAKYSENTGKFQSPMLKAKKINCDSSSSEAGCSSSSSSSNNGSSSEAQTVDKFSLSDSEEEDSNSETKEESSKNQSLENSDSPSKSESLPESKPELSPKLCNGSDTNSDGVAIETSVSTDEKKVKESEKCDIICDAKLDNEIDLVKSSDLKSSPKEETELKEKSPDNINGDTNLKESNSPFKGKGGKKGLFGKLVLDHTKSKNASVPKKTRRLAACKAEEIYRQMKGGADLDSGSDLDDEEEEEEIEGVCPAEIDGEDSDDEEEEEEEEDEDSELEEEDSEEEEDVDNGGAALYSEAQIGLCEEPGYESGCTACVALLRGPKLYVANVGDSRCVVCRDGEAVDMSLDHKPEDEPESDRINKAGGKVTMDGRVNGGLNLSRALGDHSYKLNKTLLPEEQMISPLPDIKTLDLEEKDRFVIIACDGIWNSMSSQEACDFVSKKLDQHEKLSSICEQLFDYCLAPNIEGDGAGCDNMTCIILRVDPKVLNKSQQDTTPSAVGAKRPFSELSASDTTLPEITTNGIQEKKLKLDDGAS